MAILVWFLVGLLTGLAFAFYIPTLPGFVSLKETYDGFKATRPPLPQPQPQPQPQPHSQPSSSPPVTAPSATVPQTSPAPPLKQQGKATNFRQPSVATNQTRRLGLVEFDPLSATNLSNKPAVEPASWKRISRGSLRSRGAVQRGSLQEKKGKEYHIRPAEHDNTAAPAPEDATPIPMDPESRWRDHHLKRQWAQSMLIESMEPVLSRHLRHSIKAVLHFTSVGPETMEMKAASQSWDSFIAPVVLPPPPPKSLQTSTSEATPAQSTWNRNGVRARAFSNVTATEGIGSTKAVESIRSLPNNSSNTPHQLEPTLTMDSLSSNVPTANSLPPTDDTQVASQRSRAPSSSIKSMMPIVVRGFSSSDPSSQGAAEKDTATDKRRDPEEFSEIDLGPPIAPVQTEDDTTQDSARTLGASGLSVKGQKSKILEPGSQNHVLDKQRSESHSQDTQLQQSESTPTPTSQPSRLWSRVRRAVQGDSKQAGQSRSSIYLSATGAYAGAVRSVSDTHLPGSSSSRSASASSRDSSLNTGMPSFSSSALSLLSEDQMSSQCGPNLSADTNHSALRVSVVAFETPPETAANSPTPISPVAVSPITATASSIVTSPAKFKSRSAYPHNLPGLARRSSTKSSAAAAELTTAEFRVSQFTYSWQQSHHVTGSHSRVQSIESIEAGEAVISGLAIQNEHFAAPTVPERSNSKSVIQTSRTLDDGAVGTTSEKGTTAVNVQLTRSKSDAQKRDAFQQQQKRFADYTGSETQTHLDQQQDRCPPSPAMAKNSGEEARPKTAATTTAMKPRQPRATESGSWLSPSQFLNTTAKDGTPSSPTKQDRRRSAISFGGYFANPSSEAARKARDKREHSVTGLETDDSKGEVIHLRQTSFFEKSASPGPVPASPAQTGMLSSMLQSSFPNLSSSPGSKETTSTALSRSPSRAFEMSQYHQRRISTELTRPISAISMHSVTGVGIGAGSGAAAAAVEAAAVAATGTGTGAGDAKEARKNITALKITPLLLSGVSSLPSPMFPPLSATIPRPLGSSFPLPTLDRYFFGVDQVHEWNIPSYGRVKFTDHAPLVFHAIRERFHYTLADMDEALSQPMTVMKTPGKSDAIFFASHNHGRFLLKTLRKSEPENLKAFLSDYLAHIHKHPNTMLPRYLGMYTFERISGSKALYGNVDSAAGGGGVGTGGLHNNDRDHGLRSRISSSSTGLRGKLDTAATTAQHLHLNGTLLSGKDDGLPSKVVVVVLANVFDTPEVVHERYDFKGSNVGRRTLTTTQPQVMREKSNGASLIGQDLPRSTEQVKAASVDMDPTKMSQVELARRRSRIDELQFSRGNRLSSAQLEPAQEECGQNGSATMTVEEQMDDISHLTLKEMDFQNRVQSGETQLIHLGPSRRSELLSQLEEDTALLRKHGLMDYSMLVGIKLVPKRQEQDLECDSSDDSGQSQFSRGSDADNSNLDSDDEVLSVSGSTRSSNMGAQKSDVGLALDKLWKLMNISGVLKEDHIAFLKELREKAQITFREVYSSGGGVFGNTPQKLERFKKSKKRPSAVELKPVHASQIKKDRHGSIVNKAGRRSKRRNIAGTMDEWFDPESFQTVRYKTRKDAATRRPTLNRLLDIASTPSNFKSGKRKKQINNPEEVQSALSSSRPKSNFLQEPRQQQQQQHQHQPIWSQGVPSEGLPVGYEVVYYFGLIDVLQKYNLTKWLERNLKGANARLLGGGGSGPQSPAQLVHQPRPGTGSTSFAASTFYHLLPQATASEPTLPIVLDSTAAINPTLSVLLEDPGLGTGSEVKTGSDSSGGLSTSMSSNSGGDGHAHAVQHMRGLQQPGPSSYTSSMLTSPFSSARTSQEESTLYPAPAPEAVTASMPTTTTATEEMTDVILSHESSSSTASTTTPAAIPAHSKPRVNSSVPFTKSIGARLSQYSQYSHSSQQSQHSHQSGRSRDSRLSMDIRDVNGSESAPAPQQPQPQPHQQQQHYSFGFGLLSASPPSLTMNKQQPEASVPQQHPQQQQRQFQMPQQAEVSVEEPGRYAERLVEFMRGVIV
ncbi:Phosphatidylinositol 5-phosphate 4-kinase type-2 alpha [Mortierella sp. GBA30]|nr:Phosphatidylinositol 5-phosphate 4-kinase type-2 alpha [Mortierella sp. GBA30]